MTWSIIARINKFLVIKPIKKFLEITNYPGTSFFFCNAIKLQTNIPQYEKQYQHTGKDFAYLLKFLIIFKILAGKKDFKI